MPYPMRCKLYNLINKAFLIADKNENSVLDLDEFRDISKLI